MSNIEHPTLNDEVRLRGGRKMRGRRRIGETENGRKREVEAGVGTKEPSRASTYLCLRFAGSPIPTALRELCSRPTRCSAAELLHSFVRNGTEGTGGKVIAGIMLKKCCCFSSWLQEEVPLKISISVLFCQPTMSSVFFFDSTKVSLQRIGGGRDFGVVNIMKQVREGSDNHARC